MINFQLILLAAGGSARMGRPKQLLPWRNELLIGHQIKKLMKTGYPLNVVLGASADKIIPVVEEYNVKIIINDEWEEGMASSINSGIKSIIKNYPATDAVLIALLDQPLITTEHFLKLLHTFQTKKDQIIVSVSDTGWEGVPVVFDRCYFNELQKLNGKEGAKKLIQTFRGNVKRINSLDPLDDVDTPEDYQRMLNR
ncbi:MAG TPA: nucleotidyltransferase family protein [Draconibacterium sp.]|nr:nucleotidyltransferase family protein [Draconibacterium sp.]